MALITYCFLKATKVHCSIQVERNEMRKTLKRQKNKMKNTKTPKSNSTNKKKCIKGEKQVKNHFKANLLNFHLRCKGSFSY